jgi:hypothetical protein
MRDLAAEYLRERLRYDPDTGVFTWRLKPGRTKWERRWNGRYAGTEAGDVMRGYRRIGLAGRRCWAHRLAFLYMTGAEPAGEVDHRDGNGLNNRWTNLRPATRTDNTRNVGVRRDSASGLKGIRRVYKGRYSARIQVNGERRYLGYFRSLDEARAAYSTAAREHHGAFARTA